MIYTRFLWYMEQMIYKHYEISSTIKHRGERGRSRENGLAVFLSENLPEAYGVATGEIISAEGEEISPQCDIIIYDRLFMPIIGKNEAVQQIPIEAVYAVIEVKSTINKAELKETFDNFEQIRSMSRCEPYTLLADGMKRGPVFYLFGYKLRTSRENCVDYVRNCKSPIGNEIDSFIFALDTGGIVVYGDKETQEDQVLWLNATGKVEDRNIYHTLGMFFVSLLADLQQIDLGRVDLMEMIRPLGPVRKEE